MINPKVSILCPTRDRPLFHPWLLWNYKKQTWGNKELIIADSSYDRGALVRAIIEADVTGVTVVDAHANLTIGETRNQLLEHAQGDIICWFDDDDWQHPRKLETMVEVLSKSSKPWCGMKHGWFVRLRDGAARPYVNQSELPAPVTVGVLRDVARAHKFNRSSVGEDTYWVGKILLTHPTGVYFDDDFLSEWWLVHPSNSTQRERHNYDWTHNLEHVKKFVGRWDWGETDLQLRELRERIAP